MFSIYRPTSSDNSLGYTADLLYLKHDSKLNITPNTSQRKLLCYRESTPFVATAARESFIATERAHPPLLQLPEKASLLQREHTLHCYSSQRKLHCYRESTPFVATAARESFIATERAHPSLLQQPEKASLLQREHTLRCYSSQRKLHCYRESTPSVATAASIC